MPTFMYELESTPTDERTRELWLQHTAGLIIFEDVRQCAIDQIDPTLDEAARAAAMKGIDDAVGGLMQICDGVTGALRNATTCVSLKVMVSLAVRDKEGAESVEQEVDLFDGDGMCMGYYGWLEGDYGSVPIARRKESQ